MPKTIFYARVSTRDQNPALQIDAAKTLDVKTGDIFVEKASGSRDRPVLAKALAACEKGDTLACWKLDRVGRSVTHLSKLLADLEARGVHFRTIEDGLDTRGSTGKLVLHMLGAVAQFERDLIIERTKAGLAIARKNGKRLGPPIAGHGEAGQEVDEVRRAELSGSRQHVEGFSPDAISRLEGCARARRAFRGVTMRILICGGRQFEDAGFLWQAMDELHAKTPITEVIVGGAAGADTLGEQWAKDRRIPYRIFLADWATHGRAAGPIRNKAMLDEGSRIWSSFPGGRGTA